MTRDADHFEINIPLKWVGKRNLKLGSRNDLHILFLDGYEKLDHNYTGDLKELGYTLIDCNKVYKAYEKEHPQLNRYRDFEKKCFLRWLVIADIFGHEPIMHYDADIVFNEIPENIEKQLGGLTFVLQGCPAFVSTGKSDWLAQYKKNLITFVKDISAYSAAAWKERPGWEKSYLDKWSGSRFKNIISHDQDFISHLIHTDQLPQESPSVIRKKTDLILFENLLEFHDFYPDLLPVEYKRIDGVDYFNDRKVAFWHMQTDVNYYLKCILRRGFMNRVSKYKCHLKEKSIEHLLWNVYDRGFRKEKNRLEVYKYYFELGDFSEVLNGKAYWKENVFR